MISVPKQEISYWQSQAVKTSYKPLSEDVEVDVAIVGGGITGLTAAYLIKQSGFSVAVLEKNTIGSGTTSHTTGKLTSQHNLIYCELEKRLGRQTARTYAEANQTAVQEIIGLIKKEKIDCELEQDNNYVYTTDAEKTSEFKDEAKTAAKLGLPATFETHLELPFKVRAAVRFSNQAKLSAQKYVDGLASLVDGQGSHVFEHSEADGFQDGQPAIVNTKTAKVTAKNILVMTKIPTSPLIARVAYAALEHPHTSYIVAGVLNKKLSGMYISSDKNHYSILPVNYGEKRLLLIGGQHHTPGLGNPNNRYQRLADYAEKYFDISSIAYHWKGMDYLAYDDLPLIGKLYPWSRHIYTATGFKKWGLSTSMVSGMILRDAVIGTANSWAPAFNSMRTRPITSIPYALVKSLKS